MLSVITGLLHQLYLRWGSRYPMRVIVSVIAQGQTIVLISMLAALLFVDFSVEEWVSITLAGQAMAALEAAIVLRETRKVLAPVMEWIDGGKGRTGVIPAWHALSSLPTRMVGARPAGRVTAYALTMCGLIALFAPLPFWPSAAVVVLAVAIILSAGLLFRYLAIELVLRPVLEDAALNLTTDARVTPTLSLRRKLIFGIPLITLAASGSVATYDSIILRLRDGDPNFVPVNNRELFIEFGLGLIFAMIVTATVAVILSVLLARSFMAPIKGLQRTAEAIREGDLDKRAPVMGGDEIGILAQSFNLAIDGLQQRDQLQEALDAYIDPVVASRVLDEGTVLDAEAREVTVAFVDVRSFTKFSEQAEAKQVFALLTEFFGVVVPVVEQHGGHANTFLGDGLLVVFGAPETRTFHADAAVATMIEVAEVVRKRFRGDLSIGIGVNSGEIAMGTISGGNRTSFTVIGDVVNTASRVEAITRRTGDVMLITEQTRRMLRRDHGELRALPPEPMRGKSEPIPLHAVIAAGAAEGSEAEIADRLQTLAQSPELTQD